MKYITRPAGKPLHSGMRMRRRCEALKLLEYLAHGFIIEHMGILNAWITYHGYCNFVYGSNDHVDWCPKYRRKVLINQIGALSFVMRGKLLE
jgi:hypothetical protein